MKNLTLVLFVALASVCWGQNLNWLPLFQGQQNPSVSDSVSGSPTMTLFNVNTPVTFSSIYFRITKADTNVADLYDIGIGQCPANDCSQPNQPITIVCSWGGITLTATGPQSYPCVQGTVTLQPGTYIYLGVGNAANIAKCQGQQGVSSITPFVSTVIGSAVSANLQNVTIFGSTAPNFLTAAAGARVGADICAISLH